ncbi:MAG: hypothetical protein Q7K26_00755 [bacterium]|nr:hypothetical protein [bacterium]
MNNKITAIILLTPVVIGGVLYFYNKDTSVIKEETIAALNQKIYNGGVFITPLEVVSDSRCPIDVVCIWAGEVSLKVKLDKGIINKEVIFKQQIPLVFEGNTISLIDVTPENNSKQPINKEDYRFTFLITSL